MSRLDNYYESINALAAGQPEQFILTQVYNFFHGLFAVFHDKTPYL